MSSNRSPGWDRRWVPGQRSSAATVGRHPLRRRPLAARSGRAAEAPAAPPLPVAPATPRPPRRRWRALRQHPRPRPFRPQARRRGWKGRAAPGRRSRCRSKRNAPRRYSWRACRHSRRRKRPALPPQSNKRASQPHQGLHLSIGDEHGPLARLDCLSRSRPPRRAEPCMMGCGGFPGATVWNCSTLAHGSPSARRRRACLGGARVGVATGRREPTASIRADGPRMGRTPG